MERSLVIVTQEGWQRCSRWDCKPSTLGPSAVIEILYDKNKNKLERDHKINTSSVF